VNVQRIWNEGYPGGVQCRSHLDINLEMMYWPAEISNLTELTVPLVSVGRSKKSAGERIGPKPHARPRV
jgi:alpha-L-fucosidase 2